ncbi:unnamed protein product [Nippostrongylus brasiliensis]|uniref:SCP domain-containing protein n=1 Tax=Nippostrongylus brasiliensis TaxID=27835 RepID=A0A0N4XUQ6_NIPBR|nr:unnamed protein product [Nippostrongylus brasiliensis]
MNDRIRQQALGAHNYRRSLLALNRVRKNTGRLLPGATNMRKYTYDCTLENNARLVAETCVSTPNTAGVVENVHQLSKSSAADRVTAMRLAVVQWWKQVRRVPGFGMKAIYRPKHQGTAIEPFIKARNLISVAFRWPGLIRRVSVVPCQRDHSVATRGQSYVTIRQILLSPTLRSTYLELPALPALPAQPAFKQKDFVHDQLP